MKHPEKILNLWPDKLNSDDLEMFVWCKQCRYSSLFLVHTVIINVVFFKNNVTCCVFYFHFQLIEKHPDRRSIINKVSLTICLSIWGIFFFWLLYFFSKSPVLKQVIATVDFCFAFFFVVVVLDKVNKNSIDFHLFLFVSSSIHFIRSFYLAFKSKITCDSLMEMGFQSFACWLSRLAFLICLAFRVILFLTYLHVFLRVSCNE